MATHEMNTAIDRLQDLPEDTQNMIASSINEYLNKLDDLRDTIQASRQSGTPTVLSKRQLLDHIHKNNKELLK